MSSAYEIHDVAFTHASRADVQRGVLGFVAFRIGPGLLVDGAVLRRSAEGRHGLAFPARKDRAGRRHYAIRPADDATRENLEAQILDALRGQGVLR